MTTRQEYQQFLNDNFKGLKIRGSLFYNWDTALRFNLQVGETDTDQYFDEVLKRSTTLFKSVFQPKDNVFIVFMDYKYKRNKIRPGNFSFQQITDLNKHEITYSKAHKLYEQNDRFDIRNVAVIKTQTERINYKNILRAIGNTDFPPRQPRLDKKGVLTSKEIYFLNITRKAIFHMYDDRGLDIIASDVELLQPIYDEYSNWLLDYDRAKMDSVLKKNGL